MASASEKRRYIVTSLLSADPTPWMIPDGVWGFV